jgi:hypothetical protein
MATDWSEEAKARRSASAKKAAETRRANQAAKAAEFQAKARQETPNANLVSADFAEAEKRVMATIDVNSPSFLAAQARITQRLIVGDGNLFREYYQGSRLARLLCRTASPYTLFVATWRVAADEMRRLHQRLMVPRKYVLTPSRHKRPFRFA